MKLSERVKITQQAHDRNVKSSSDVERMTPADLKPALMGKEKTMDESIEHQRPAYRGGSLTAYDIANARYYIEVAQQFHEEGDKSRALRYLRESIACAECCIEDLESEQ
jgi:hypothetical protein